jgi:hypothetical protein
MRLCGINHQAPTMDEDLNNSNRLERGKYKHDLFQE